MNMDSICQVVGATVIVFIVVGSVFGALWGFTTLLDVANDIKILKTKEKVWATRAIIEELDSKIRQLRSRIEQLETKK